MNNERLKKLLYDLETTTNDLNKSLKLIKQFDSDEELKGEISNSLKYKFLSLFIIYEDFISMMLKEYNQYEIGMSVDSAIKKIALKKYITCDEETFLHSARIIRNKIGHRYKQPSIEVIVKFLEDNLENITNIEKLIRGYLK